MSNFTNANQTRPASPAKVYHKWSSGTKTEVKTEAGTFTKVEGKLNHWDAKTNTRVSSDISPEKPFRFVVLEQTRRISGFNGTKRYFSNEAVSYDDILRISEKEYEKSAVVVASGTYRQLKQNKEIPEGASLAVNLYGYNLDTKQIEVITLQKSSLKPFIDISQKTNIYQHQLYIVGQDAKQTFGSVEFYPPKFEIGPKHTQEEIAEYLKYNNEIAEYLKWVKGDNHQDQSESVLEELTGKVPQTNPSNPGQEEDILFDEPF